jgi:hypothetical protein
MSPLLSSLCLFQSRSFCACLIDFGQGCASCGGEAKEHLEDCDSRCGGHSTGGDVGLEMDTVFS